MQYLFMNRPWIMAKYYVYKCVVYHALCIPLYPYHDSYKTDDIWVNGLVKMCIRLA